MSSAAERKDSMGSVLASPPPASSPFSDALSEFVNGFGKRKKPSFVQDYLNGSVVNSRDIQTTLEDIEEKSSRKQVRRFLEPIVQAMVDYTGVLDTLCQADPMPTALIWGCLRAFIGCCGRYVNLYTLIKTQLLKLTHELERLKDYDDLFGHSKAMQELLKVSYLHILQFYTRVENQCRSPSAIIALKSLASFSTKRMDDILAAITENGNNIAKLVPIIQERIRQRAQKDVVEEYRKAEIAQNNLLVIMKNQEDERQLRDQERRYNRKKEVRQWIRGGFTLNESNLRHQKKGETAFATSTGASPWLLQSPEFDSWISQTTSSRGLWLRGGCGTGKTVICSYAVTHVKSTAIDAGVAFHYYRFDEPLSSTMVYRNIAEQLYDQLYLQDDDISDNIHDLARDKSDNRDSLKEMIKILVSELSQTYIFLDGLDEECTDESRWEEACDAVGFFKDLVEDDRSTVGLWCSSQDRSNIREKLRFFLQIQLDEGTNEGTIEVFFANAMPLLDPLDLDPGTKNLVIGELRAKARGNFLWASLMVDTIRGATSLQDLQKELNDALPYDFERYYARKIGAVEGKNRSTICNILSILVYAKRPLLVEELCDAMGACDTTHGRNISKEAPLFKSKVRELCEPLVEVQEMRETNEGFKTVCSLSHSAVHRFLIKNPRILSKSTTNGQVEDDKLSITPQTLARTCLKYLSQPCYGHLLQRKGKKFVTKNGQDIDHHHLLSYAAKYWSIHLDDVPPGDDWSDQVADFVKSRQFLTVIQVQSLMVEGQFTMWLSLQSGLGFKRAFPRWFPSYHACGKLISQQYNEFVGEWSYLLDKDTTSLGDIPGEINRCLWGTLGSQNFLYQSSRKLIQSKSFSFLDHKRTEKQQHEQCYDRVNSSGGSLQTFRVRNCDKDKTQSQIFCERWKIYGSHRPEMQQSQTITVPAALTRLYEAPLRSKVVGRPPPISCTPDFKFARVGSRIFAASESGQFEPMESLNESDLYFEEMASNGPFVAIATRRRLSEEDLDSTTGLDDFKIEDFGKIFSEIVDKVSRLSVSPKDQDSLTTSDETPETQERSNASSRSSSTSRSTVSVVSTLKEEEETVVENAISDVKDYGIHSDSSDTSMLSLSARESWSEASTDPLSDEEEDAEQYNDWASDESVSDYKSEVSEEHEMDVEEFDEDLHGFGGGSSDSDASDEYSGSDDGSESDDSSTGRNSSDESDDVFDAAAELEAALGRDRNDLHETSKNQRGKLLIYDTNSDDKAPLFRYECGCPRTLFNSPPVFHPSAPLVVWPLGGEGILFANFQEKTYFTRTLRRSASRSCHVSIQAKFSPCGEYLHLGALEVREDPQPHLRPGKPCIHLSFQLSTHRLSKRKTVRSPPRLIFRTGVPLASLERLSVSPLPYTFTWTTDHVYVSRSQETLQVIRVPLFRHSKVALSDDEMNGAGVQGPECHVRSKEIFLPSSAAAREVHYFAPKSDAKAKNLATVILGSRSPSLVGGTLKSRYESLHPLGVYVDEQAQLDGWKSVDGMKGEDALKNTGCGGRLQGKFEEFDRTDDCDIVPYLC